MTAPAPTILSPLSCLAAPGRPGDSSCRVELWGPSLLSHLIHPAIFYALWVLGGLGVCIALPRRKASPQLLGALVAALAGGLFLIALGWTSRDHLPNLYFYIFSLLGLGAALRVITHPRPVYAALYFILTVLASAGLFLILSAEFMAFALIIVYAGAILITYLFVIMLATQAPEEGEVEVLATYDTQAREPAAATVVGFLLLAVLTSMMFKGVDELRVPGPMANNSLLTYEPRKVESVFRNHHLLDDGGTVSFVDAAGREITAEPGGRLIAAPAAITIYNPGKQPHTMIAADWPEEMSVKNVEHLGFNLLREHPGTIEIAGVILLMAMLGAVVLSRKQVQMDEEAKGHRSRMIAQDALAGVAPGIGRSPLETPPATDAARAASNGVHTS